MHRVLTRVVALLAVLAGAAALALTLSAQAPQAPPQDILPSILTEIRGLRAAMEQMASAGPRVELALGRLQLQEQRINALVRRLESVRDRRTAAEREIESRELQLKVVKSGEAGALPIERGMAEYMIEQAKADLARLTADIQRLTAEESDLTAEVASEQARWTAINQQLEELERSLQRR